MSWRNADGVWLSTVTRSRRSSAWKASGERLDPVGHDDEPAAVEERAPELPDGEVEGERVEQRPDVVAPKSEPAARGAQRRATFCVRDHDALRPAGRARRVDHVRGAGWRHQEGESRHCRSREQIHLDDGGAALGDAVDVSRLGNDRPDAGVFESEVDAGARIVGIDRDVTRARLEDAKDRRDKLDRRGKEDADEHARPYAAQRELVGEHVCARRELAIGARAVLERDGDGIGGPSCLLLEERDHGLGALGDGCFRLAELTLARGRDDIHVAERPAAVMNDLPDDFEHVAEDRRQSNARRGRCDTRP